MILGVRSVKGVLFRDYVRMLRAHKDTEAWRSRLLDEDLVYVDQRIDPQAWYPMATFERMGNAILACVANGELVPVRMWGRLSAAQLRQAEPMLVSPGDPVETLSRFHVLRQTYFDFAALEVLMLHDDEAEIAIAYHMGMPAEEAATMQTIGFFEGLLELAGARDVRGSLSSRSWAGDPRTTVRFRWTMPAR
jgi:hypothetical protein